MNKIIISDADTNKGDCIIYDKQGREYIVKEAIINEQKELWIKVEEE